jgi:hypothetical protein
MIATPPAPKQALLPIIIFRKIVPSLSAGIPPGFREDVFTPPVIVKPLSVEFESKVTTGPPALPPMVVPAGPSELET